ncbi:MAG: hypothetical protein SGJ03_06360 [Alphaproteobacteria bacterium]|nr:hypothetical protein [Alphaproteobacteria bacterium]
MSAPAYECTFRHVAFVLTSICVLMVVMFAGIAAAVTFIADGKTILSVILYLVGAIVVLVILAAVPAYATHRWTIEPTGIRIEEEPKIPFMGISRKRTIAFADIAALRHLESGLDIVIEIATRDGNAYRVMANGAGVPDLQAFAAQIASASATAGHKPLAMSDGMSFWNRPLGLIVLVVMMFFTLAFAGATAWALFGGGLGTSRNGYYAVFVLALPFGVVYLLYKSLTRRRRVLRLLAGAKLRA